MTDHITASPGLSANTATISPCGQYRYTLSRETGLLYPETGSALFIMLNPSTADASLDDPTIRRCIGFAKTWGCPGLTVANLYALRSTNPNHLWQHDDPVGPDNDHWLRNLASEFEDVVCAWGANAKPGRVQDVVEILTYAGARLWCLGATKSGAPKHPLYIKSDQALVEWPAAQEELN